MKKEIEMEMELMTVNNSQIGQKIIYRSYNGKPDKLVGSITRMIDGKVFALIQREDIHNVLQCLRAYNEDKKPAHPLTKAFM